MAEYRPAGWSPVPAEKSGRTEVRPLVFESTWVEVVADKGYRRRIWGFTKGC